MNIPCNLSYFQVEFRAANSTGITFTGALHHDYAAVNEECLVVASPCSRSFEENAEAVFGYFRYTISPLLGEKYPGGYLMFSSTTGKEEISYNSTVRFDCWGHQADKLVYIEHTFSKQKVILSLAIPGGVCLLGILLVVTLASDRGAVLSIIRKCFGGCCPACKRRPTPVRSGVVIHITTSPSSERRRRVSSGIASVGAVEIGRFREAVEREGLSDFHLAEDASGPVTSSEVDPSTWSGSSAHSGSAVSPSYTSYDAGHVNPPPSSNPLSGYNSSSLPPGSCLTK